MATTALAAKWGKSLRAARLDMGFTQEALALRAGTTQTTLSKIENGVHVPSDELRICLAIALGTTVEALFRYSQSPSEVIA